MTDPGKLLQKAFIEYVESIRPDQDSDSRRAIADVEASISVQGFWHSQDEWRISTWFDTRIEPERVGDRVLYQATVECDGQMMQCRCPSIEKAYLFSRFYQHLIVNQFYSVGPPWA